jgi:hypothetical protein
LVGDVGDEAAHRKSRLPVALALGLAGGVDDVDDGDDVGGLVDEVIEDMVHERKRA